MTSGILAYEELEYHYSIQHIESIKEQWWKKCLSLLPQNYGSVGSGTAGLDSLLIMRNFMDRNLGGIT
jgi:hypothetical protein